MIWFCISTTTGCNRCPSRTIIPPDIETASLPELDARWGSKAGGKTASTREAPVGSIAATVVTSNVAPFQLASEATTGIRQSSISAPTGGAISPDLDPVVADDINLLGERRPIMCTFVAVHIQKRVASAFHLTPHPEAAPKRDGGAIPVAEVLIVARRGRSFFDLVAPLYARSVVVVEEFDAFDSGIVTVHEKK
jgi:hypothetical protein